MGGLKTAAKKTGKGLKKLGKAIKSGALATRDGLEDAAEATVEALKKAGKGISRAAKATGRAISSAAKATGKGISHVSKRAGKAISKGAKAVGKAAKATAKGISKAAKATAKGISKAAKATGKGISKAGRSIFNWGKKIYGDMKKHLTKYGCRRYHFQCLYGTRETRKQGKVGNQKLCRAVKTICYMLAEDPSLKKQVVIETDKLFMNDEDTDALEKSIAKTVDISKGKGSKFHAAVKKAVNELYNALSPKCQHDFMTIHAEYKKDASKLAKEEYKGDMLGHVIDSKDM